MITVRLPASLRTGSGDTLELPPVATLGVLIEVLESHIPGFGTLFADAMFNFAVNDDIVLAGTRDKRLKDGDTVEIIPALSGG